MKSLYVMMLEILVIEADKLGVSVNYSHEKSLTDYEVMYKHSTGDRNIIVSVVNSNIDRIIINNGLEQHVLKDTHMTDLIKDLFIRDNFYNIIRNSNQDNSMSVLDLFPTQVLHG